ncbi:FUN14 domain-containing protein [Candidatus Marithrix sp. Canyon 246]|uniref:FUN14 domain-containing protein n=1 Tax=Candidatus Marithrix sp. Canyon 246 TaxID=1827136 RepID=UPI00084A1555|nr:FUN14 domain-containing protein [Candidatus Marithrix sp. Canyon 246]
MTNEKLTPVTKPDHSEPVDYTVPTWQKYLLIIALVLSAIGLSLQAVAFFQGENTAAGSDGNAMTLESRSTEAASSTESDKFNLLGVDMSDWSILLTKVGFSFFVGFCLGYVFRIFLKIIFIVCGVVFLLLFGLEYASVVKVDWIIINGYYDGFFVWLKPHASTLQEFVKSNLPSAGLATAGLLVGLKKK